MKNCLMTGVSGLIGSNLTNILDSEYNIYGIIRSKKFLNKTEKFTPVYADIADEINFSDMPDTIDAVIHLAQSSNFRNFPDMAEDIFQVNTHSTLQLLEFARKKKAGMFILASTGGVYSGNTGYFKEDFKIHYSNLDFYQLSKFSSELLVNAYKAYFTVIVLRFFFVYGPTQNKTMLIPRIVQNISEGKSIDLNGEQGIFINPVFVDDAACAVKASLNLQESEIINVAGEKVHCIREIAEMIGDLLSKEVQFNIRPSSETNHFVGDISLLKRVIGTPKIKLYDGLSKYIAALS